MGTRKRLSEIQYRLWSARLFFGFLAGLAITAALIVSFSLIVVHLSYDVAIGASIILFGTLYIRWLERPWDRTHA